MKQNPAIVVLMAALTLTAVWALDTPSPTQANSTSTSVVPLPQACRLLDDRERYNGRFYPAIAEPTGLTGQKRVVIVNAWDDAGTPVSVDCGVPAEATALVARVSARRPGLSGPSWIEAGPCRATVPTTSKAPSLPVRNEWASAGGVIIPLSRPQIVVGGRLVLNREFCLYGAAANTEWFVDVEAVLVPA